MVGSRLGDFVGFLVGFLAFRRIVLEGWANCLLNKLMSAMVLRFDGGTRDVGLHVKLEVGKEIGTFVGKYESLRGDSLIKFTVPTEQATTENTTTTIKLNSNIIKY